MENAVIERRKASDQKVKWHEGIVDPDDDHIKLTYGKVIEDKNMPVVALLSPTVKGKENDFTVQFVDLNGVDKSKKEKIMRDVKEDLNYLLIHLNKKYPWQYAIYHCSTATNIYSMVHWSYYPKWYIDKKRTANQNQ